MKTHAGVTHLRRTRFSFRVYPTGVTSQQTILSAARSLPTLLSDHRDLRKNARQPHWHLNTHWQPASDRSHRADAEFSSLFQVPNNLQGRETRRKVKLGDRLSSPRLGEFSCPRRMTLLPSSNHLTLLRARLAAMAWATRAKVYWKG